MAEITFPKNPNKDTPIFEADNGVQYKWEGDGTSWGVWRALGGSSVIIEPPPAVKILQPLILSPENNSGLGGDITYNPTSSEITKVDILRDVGSWSGSSGVPREGWNSVAYGNGIYVAIKYVTWGANQVIVSTDGGKTFINGGTPPAKNYLDITYGEPIIGGTPTPRFVAVAGSGNPTSIAYSPDGITWYDSDPLPAIEIFTSVHYANGIYVAVGNGGYSSYLVMYSTDGKTWTPANTSSTPPTPNYYDVTYGETDAGGVWVAVGKSCMMRSTDNAKTWTYCAWTGGLDNIAKLFSSIKFGNGVFVVGNSDTSPKDGGFLVSTDGDTFNFTQGAYVSESSAPVVFTGSEFYAYSTTGKFQRSVNGLDWTSDSTDNDPALNIGGWAKEAIGDTDIVMVGGSYPYATYTKLVSNTTLTFDDDKAYDTVGGSQKGLIDEKFKAGDKVVGVSDVTLFAPKTCFHTEAWSATGSEYSVNNSIDLLNGKGLVWVKHTGYGSLNNYGYDHALVDTLRGETNRLASNKRTGQLDSGIPIEFTATGYKLPGQTGLNGPAGESYVSFCFRAAPKFFDIVTWGPGDGSGEVTIPHSLGSTPGMIIEKQTSNDEDWFVYHKDVGLNSHLQLNNRENANFLPQRFTDVNDKTFTTLGNNSGENNVAYVFADTPGLIKCGYYTGNGKGTPGQGVEVDCGFKPQWLLIKAADGDGDWYIFDKEIGLLTNDNLFTKPNMISKGGDGGASIGFLDTADKTGFTVTSYAPSDYINETGYKYIFVAIAEDAVAGELPPTGVLTEDADPVLNTMTLKDVTGTWTPGLYAVNENELTNLAPGADEIEFLSSKPESEGAVIAKYEAHWELSTDSGWDDAKTQKKSVDLKEIDVEEGPEFDLKDDTEYYVRTRYEGDGTLSEWSKTHHFQTGGGAKDGWFSKEVPGKSWRSITYGDGKFVAVSNSNKQVMYAEDPADTWTTAKTPYANWRQIIYGGGKFVAVAEATTPGLSNYVLYASDPAGPWTEVNTSHPIRSITYGDGKFVAVLQHPNNNNHVMYAADPAGPWSYVKTSETVYWNLITYGDNKFVGVKNDRIMYAEDPTDFDNWSYVSTPRNVSWESITYGNGTFVAISSNYSDSYIMHAENPAGPWSHFATPAGANWESIVYGDGRFVAVASAGESINRIMYADDPTDAANWKLAAAPENTKWKSITHGNGKFVAVAYEGEGKTNVMYSSTGAGDPLRALFYDENIYSTVTNHTLTKRYGVDPLETDLSKFGIFPLTEQPSYQVAYYEKIGDKYKPIRDYTDEINRLQARVIELEAGDDTVSPEPTPTPEPDPTPVATTFNVSVQNGKYFINGIQQQALNLTKGNTYVFDFSVGTAYNHPLRIYTSASKASEYTNGVTTTSETLTFTVPQDAPIQLHYQCSLHALMGGVLTIS